MQLANRLTLLWARLGPDRRTRLERIAPLAVYAAITLVVTLRHEAWRDEADTWLYARDADVATILGRLRYMGTPGLWYFLLYPLAKSGLPYEAQALLHYGLAVAAAAVFWLCAPLPRLTKLLFLFGYFMAYEYAVVARTYVLTVLLVFAIAALNRRRLERPIAYGVSIALLFHANAHSIGIAATVSAAYAWDVLRQRPVGWFRLAVLAGVGLSGILALLLLSPPPDPNISSEGSPVPLAALVSIGNAFMPKIDPAMGSAAGLLALGALAVILARHPQSLFLLAGSVAWLLYVFVFRYSGSPRHHGLLLVVAVLAAWTAASGAVGVREVRRLRLALYPLMACLAASCVISALHWGHEYAYAFSAAKEMAAYVKSEQLTDRTIAAHRPAHGESVLPYLPGVRLWYLGLGEYGTYMRWDAAYAAADAMPFEEAVERFSAVPQGGAGRLMLLNEPLPAEYGDRFRLVYATQSRVFYHVDETYYLYELLS